MDKMKFFAALGVLALAVAVANAGVSMNNPNYCYMTDNIRPMTNMFGALTSYEAIRRFNFTTVNPYMSTCEASRFWYLGRYGTRYPHTGNFNAMINMANSNFQQDIIDNYNAGRTTLCREDFDAIRTWTRPPYFNIGFASLTTPAGILAVQDIARRYQVQFPDILNGTYSRDRFLFRHTWTERTTSSIRAFATGLFGVEDAQNVVYEDVPAVDWFMRPFDFCPLFDQEHGWVSAERQAFLEGPEIQEMLEQVSDKLGFVGSNQLSFTQIFTIWDWCRFETAYTFEFSNSPVGGNSTWCAAFSVAHQLLLEYTTDLFTFHTSGYGVRNQRLLENLHCGLAQDLLNHLQSDDPTDQMARIFMGYAEEVHGMLVSLGAFRDVWPMHRHNYAQQTARNWIGSLMTPFGANLAVVRYDCDDGDHDIIFYLNERPILIRGCNQQNAVCKLSDIQRIFERFIDVNCEAFFCSNN